MKLNKNSESMKTVVETFVIEETSELIYDNEKLVEWNKLVDKLGLQGQTTIVSDEKSPIPFMFMKETLKNTLETLCPRKVDVKDYNKTPIPLEILGLVDLAVSEKHFHKIEIWYDDKSPDPCCVGVLSTWRLMKLDNKYYSHDDNSTFSSIEAAELYINTNGIKDAQVSSSTDEQYYLLGKWADVKRSFEELTEMAVKRYTKEQTHSYERTIKSYQDYIANIPNDIQNRFY